MRAERGFERAVLERDVAQREVDREMERRGFRFAVEQRGCVAMNLLIRRAVQWRVGGQLAHHGVVAGHALDDAEHVRFTEDRLIGEYPVNGSVM